MKTRMTLAALVVLFGGISPRHTAAAILDGTWGCPLYGGARTVPAPDYGCRVGTGVSGSVPELWDLREGILYPKQQMFADLTPDGTTRDVNQLAARGVIRGQPDGTFSPLSYLNRAQLAAMIVRTMGWDAVAGVNTFSDQGSIDDELWRAVGILSNKGIARGYGDGTFHPQDSVNVAQAISLVTRAMVVAGHWQQQPDNPTLFVEIPVTSGHHQDIVTYAHYVQNDQEVAIQWSLVNTRLSAGSWQLPTARIYGVEVIWGAVAPLIYAQVPKPANCRIDGKIIVCTD